MASFSYLGNFRQTQWKFLRDFLLTQRKTIASRIRVIDAEIRRIGHITVFYQRQQRTIKQPDGSIEVVEAVTERRTGFAVTPNTTLEKLIQAYIVQGGNPCEISLFLQPDDIQFETDEDPDVDEKDDPNIIANDVNVQGTKSHQPHHGVVGVESANSYGPGGEYKGGYPTFDKFPYRRIGRIVDLSDANAKVATKIDYARRWVNQDIQELRHNLEAKIIKLMDLKEQLIKERDELLVQSVGGTVENIPEVPSSARFHRGLHLTRIVESFDHVFYESDINGVPDFTTVNLGTKENPTGLSTYDTLWYDGQGGIEDDPYTG